MRWAVNDTEFIHVDFNDGKRVLAWRRGRPDSDKIAVVLANFSDFGTNPGGEYRVLNWPATPPGKQWREITQERDHSTGVGGARAHIPLGSQGLCTGVMQLGGAERETDAFVGRFLRRSGVGARTRVGILQQRASQHHCP